MKRYLRNHFVQQDEAVKLQLRVLSRLQKTRRKINKAKGVC